MFKILVVTSGDLVVVIKALFLIGFFVEGNLVVALILADLGDFVLDGFFVLVLDRILDVEFFLTTDGAEANITKLVSQKLFS